VGRGGHLASPGPDICIPRLKAHRADVDDQDIETVSMP
jgi:hypothetical protein